MSDAALKRLAEGLRLGRRLNPGARGREWLIHWLGGGGKEERRAAESELGVAGDDPERLEAAYRGLDRVLFDEGRLSAKAAGLAGMDDDSARRRYRQLIKVFHPDRFPDLAEWLTPRSQAIHEAYARFKRGETGGDNAAPAAGSTPPRRPPDVRRPWIRDAGPLWPALVAGWRARLRRVRNLPQKILALVAVVALLPVLHLYLAANGHEPAPVARQSAPVPVEPPVAPEAAASAGPVAAAEDGQREAPWWYAGGGLGADNEAHSEPAEPVQVAAVQSDGDEDGERSGETADDGAGEAASEEELQEAGDELLERWLTLLGPEFRPDRPRPVPGETGMDRDALEELEGDTAPRYRLPPLPEPEESRGSEAGEAGEADAVEDDPQREDSPDATGDELMMEAPELPDEPVVEEGAEPEASEEASGRESSRESPAAADAGDELMMEEPELPDEPVVEEDAEPEASADALSGDAPPPEDTDAGEDRADAAMADRVPEPDVLALLEGYRASIESGNLERFMEHFGSDPRENRNRGRRWFRENYGRLFRDTAWRRFDLDIENITRTDAGQWEVLAGYEMRIAYPDGRQRTSTGRTRYTIIREADRWVIGGIEH